jgi:sugar-specific transcriptional regulator TrmB
MATTTAIDLTPFAFTATESRVYETLLSLGPASGYAVARAARLARANAYGALDGLVSRGAATKAAGRPARYRPADPEALLARLAAEQGEALERLSRALSGVQRTGDQDTRVLEGSRAIATLILQVVARAGQGVEGVIGTDLLRATLPAWRRAGERAAVRIGVAGEPPPEAAALHATAAPADFPTLLVVDGRQTVIATGSAGQHSGLWSSHPAIAAIAQLALRTVR